MSVMHTYKTLQCYDQYSFEVESSSYLCSASLKDSLVADRLLSTLTQLPEKRERCNILMLKNYFKQNNSFLYLLKLVILSLMVVFS